MPFENNHIDNFFRNKANDALIDQGQMNTDWQQMQSLLIKPGTVPSKKINPRSSITRYTAYAAGVALLVTAITLKSIKNKRNGKASTTVVKTNPAPVVPLPVIQQPEQKVVPNTNNAVIVKKQSAVKKENIKQANAAVRNVTSVIKKEETTQREPLPIKPDSKTVFTNFYNALKKPAQEFMIDSQRDTLIRCQEGTSLFIRANSFQTLSGISITGTVKMEIQEFYSYADILGNKLATTSSGMPIETGGMININATALNEILKIKPGSSLDLKMPAQAFQPDMQLFVGQTAPALTSSGPSAPELDAIRDQSSSGVNWMARGQQQFFYSNDKKIITVMDLTDDPYNIKANGTKYVAKYTIPHYCKLSTNEVRRELEKKYGNRYDVIKVKRAWKPLRKKYRGLRINDYYSSFKVIGDSITIPLHLASRLKLITKEDSLQHEAFFKKKLEDAVKQKRSYGEYLEIRKEYNFQIVDLGWINCDRFMNYPRSRLTDITVEPGKGFEGAYFHAMLIFEKEKTAMPGYWNEGKVVFPNLPLGHSVNMVCTGVKDGKMFMSVQKITVERFKSPVLSFEETSPEQFRDKLAKFGTVR